MVARIGQAFRGRSGSVAQPSTPARVFHSFTFVIESANGLTGAGPAVTIPPADEGRRPARGKD